MDFSNINSLNIGTDEIIKLKLGDNVVWHKAMEFVDLGIVDSDGNHILWGTYNLGALSPYEAGWYVSWGETATAEDGYEDGIKTAGYGNGTYKFYDSASGKYTKYSTEGQYLDAEDDAVTVNMGSPYRIPSKSDWEALADSSSFTWSWESANKGYRITSKISGYEGNSIFIICAGLMVNNVQYGEFGLYNTNTMDSRADYAFRIEKESANKYITYWGERYYGLTIRPVKVVSV